MHTSSLDERTEERIAMERDTRTHPESADTFLHKYAFVAPFIPAPFRSLKLGYLLTPLLPFIASIAVYMSLHAFPHMHFEEAPILLAVILVSVCWGLLPGLIASMVGILFFVYVITPPINQFSLTDHEDLFSLVMFGVTCLSLSLLTSQLQRARIVAQQARKEAEKANLMMDDFVSIVAHELRTPLTGAKASIQLSMRQIQQAKVTQQDREKMLKSLQRHMSRAIQQLDLQNRLVRDLLDASRVRTKRLEIHPECCNLVDIVSENIENQRLLNPERVISYSGPSVDMIPLDADSDRVGQVLANYLSNALKYSDASKPVAVDVKLEKTQVRVSVRDQGPGLTREQQQHIWERFYRVPGMYVRSGSGVGLGLGLYICRSTIELHGGHVGVQSAPGQGSTFWFTLPLIDTASNEE
ncbi:sensor histidine kinase [Ktedonospora formicarum]|uniref:histidine kinase n=1 Tax=Ktedonospora formicarum TaxID=2778364 RepID=A0A8J3I3W2_9CHLR|nr:HAMP domain-containing sensor histidine kinase [Ktedonospora formicarum]GHO48276.1 hypothetical protein KSX_64390 [Ktedonospora formicarum]